MLSKKDNFSKVKNIILFIYDFKCQICGSVSTSNHVHHNDQNRKNNDVFNLIPLCVICHKMVHRNNLKLNIKHSGRVFKLLLKLKKYY